MPDQTVDLYRLTGEVISNDPNTANIGAINYVYTPDGVGNRQSRSLGITAISSQNSLTYDANGSTTTDPNGTYVYDSLGRMTSATVNGITTTYIYDGDGNKETMEFPRKNGHLRLNVKNMKQSCIFH
jgi:YD repeat-containing protein